MWAAEEGWEEERRQARAVQVSGSALGWADPRKGGCGILCPPGEAKDVNQTGLC